MSTATIEHDPVNHPKHYISENGMEVIDIIAAYGLTQSFHLGNSLKYILRAGAKGNEKQDLEKSLWYAKRFWNSDDEEVIGDWPFASEYADESFPVDKVVAEFKLSGARAEAAADLLNLCASDDPTEIWGQLLDNLERAVQEAA